MKTKSVFLFILLAFSLDGYAQKIMLFNGPPTISMNPLILVDSCAIDSSLLTVFYRFSRKEYKETIIRMQIGRKIIKQTDLHLYFNCLTYAKSKSTFKTNLRTLEHAYTDALNNSGNDNSLLFFEQIQDTRVNKVQIICGDYFKFNAPNTYQEPTPSIHWDFIEGCDTIAGYVCNIARTKFKGRAWTVWYALAIPVQTGPWKFGGLPGLILKAIDATGEFCFTCCNVHPGSSLIYEYQYGATQNFMTSQKYLRYERCCYEHPYQIFAGGEQAIVMMKDANGKMVKLDESWTIPYNPIERD